MTWHRNGCVCSMAARAFICSHTCSGPFLLAIFGYSASINSGFSCALFCSFPVFHNEPKQFGWRLFCSTLTEPTPHYSQRRLIETAWRKNADVVFSLRKKSGRRFASRRKEGKNRDYIQNGRHTYVGEIPTQLSVNLSVSLQWLTNGRLAHPRTPTHKW